MSQLPGNDGRELPLGEAGLDDLADLAGLVVRQSHENVAVFDPQRIADALIRETGLPDLTAQQVANEVRDQIERLGIRNLTSPLIRGLVNARLIENGLLDAYRAHSRLGVPAYDAARIIQSIPIEGESVGSSPLHGPEGTSLRLAEAIKREYAMLSVFSERISFAHLEGDLHIENLGEIDRPQAMICSIDYIKRHGVRLPGGFAGSRPARRPEVLASHLVTYTAALQGYFSEALTWDSVNYAFAPLLVGLNQREIRQLAQGLLFELSSPTIARGGQPIRGDLHLDWDAPAYLANLPMIGAAGERFGSTYGAVGETARNFLRILLEVYLEGDAEGRSFTGPRPIIHLGPQFFASSDREPLLELIGQLISERGGLTITFEREENGDEENRAEAAFTSRYGVGGEKLRRSGDHWQWRAAVLSSVGVNLPRLAVRGGGDQKRLFELLTDLLELAAQASLEKRVFLEKLLARGEAGSLALLAMRPAGESFLALSWTSHAICPIGLAELVQQVTGEELAESLRAQHLAWQILRHLDEEAQRLSAKHKVRFLVAESRDPAGASRLAQLDRQRLGIAAATPPGGYSNGVKLPHGNGLAALARLRIEGLLQNHRIWNGVVDLDGREAPPDLVARAFHETRANGLRLG